VKKIFQIVFPHLRKKCVTKCWENLVKALEKAHTKALASARDEKAS
jgi:hypothetical protein